MMTIKLAEAMCDAGLAIGFAEVRRYVAANAITINDELATAWDQPVKNGDVIKLGKSKSCIVGED